jgi:hypothetical protein
MRGGTRVNNILDGVSASYRDETISRKAERRQLPPKEEKRRRVTSTIRELLPCWMIRPDYMSSIAFWPTLRLKLTRLAARRPSDRLLQSCRGYMRRRSWLCSLEEPAVSHPITSHGPQPHSREIIMGAIFLLGRHEPGFASPRRTRDGDRKALTPPGRRQYPLSSQPGCRLIDRYCPNVFTPR